MNESPFLPAADSDISLNQLAAKIGVSTARLCMLAKATNIPIDTKFDPITQDQAETLQMLWHLTGGSLPSSRDNTVVPEFLRGPISTEFDPIIAAIEESLGVSTVKRSERQPNSRRQFEPRKREPQVTGTAGAVVHKWPGTSTDLATRIAKVWTGQFLFTDNEAAAWWDAGHTYQEHMLARVLRKVGITPAMLQIVVNRETVLDKLRNGLAPEHAARLLRREGYMQAS